MGMKRKPFPRARDQDAAAETPDETVLPLEPAAKPKPTLVPASSLPPPDPGKVTRLRQTKPKLTVIEGGAKKTEN